ncbi:unnamed protein product [Blepharisma stoltei]|uniref:Thioredoxin domain-containing protein n=1 Tax=Blepharisma stoltei TaxID=1481888 RepID=A0AAU9I6R2_9CILI|nr:unnamed protein product [Blepharisma stoltei]
MKFLVILGLLVLTYSFIKEKEVYDLMGPSIDDFQAKFRNETRVLAFYSPVNKKIKEFLTHYSEAAKKFMNDKTPVRLGKIDITNPSNKEYVKKYNIQSTPSIIYFLEDSDELRVYKDGKTYDDYIEVFTSKTQYKRIDL